MADQKTGGVNPIAAAVAGVVVGAGAVLAGAVAMTDKNNQAKVKEIVTNVKNDADKKRDEIEKDLAKGKAKAKKAASDGLTYLDKQVQQAKDGVKKV
jgi:uncharacterized membrane-anchored protein YhcB (DUF1043 family)